MVWTEKLMERPYHHSTFKTWKLWLVFVLSGRMHSFDSQSRLKICASRNGMITMKTLIVQPLLLVVIVTTALVDRSQHIKTYNRRQNCWDIILK